MKRFAVFGLSVMVLVAGLCVAAPAAERPSDRVVVMYFHRTQRCPTCQKMGSYAEEAVKQGFAERVEAGTVEFHYVDFQNAKNTALAKGYQVTGPSLIVAKIAENKVREYQDLEEMWTKVREKPTFLEYVRENVEAYLK